MPTEIAVDDELLERARRLGGFRTAGQTVTAALREFIQCREQLKILEVIGTIDFRRDWAYKSDRRWRRGRH